MSGLGQKQTLRRVQTMSALPPKPGIAELEEHVRLVPTTDIAIEGDPLPLTWLKLFWT